MLLQDQTQGAYEALKEEAFKTRVLLLHPNSKYRTILLAMLINDPQVNTFYYSMGPDDVDLKSFIESLTHDLANQHATFGRHLNMLPQQVYDNVKENMDMIIDSFAKELSELSDAPFLFVLDEYDRCDRADDIHHFINQSTDHIPTNCSVIVNSRTLPRLPWLAMISKNQATLLLDDNIIQENFYNTQGEGAFDLEVFALGPSYVLHQGNQIESWEGHLPRLLFFFTLDKPTVTRSEICGAFWPDLDTDQAVNVFHVTKRRLHKALGIDVLVHEESHYRINPAFNVYYDVLDFVESLMRGRNNSDQASLDAWQHATKLYRGPFLQGHNDTWVDERKVAFRAGYLEALTQMAQAWISQNNKELALKLYHQALDADFKREDVHRNLMKLYTDLGRRSEAVAHYQQLDKSFKEQGIEISSETVQVYNDLKN